jgi:hypothetical protein
MQVLVEASLWIALAYLSAVSTVAVVTAVRTGGRREDAVATREAASISRFTIPVSVILPVAPGSARVSESIAALLRLNYPSFEVIVVADGVDSARLDGLARQWQLEARELFYRQTLKTADVRRIFRSNADARLMVIDKAPGGHADALNCGVNVARYRYIMSLSPEIAFDADALLRVMSAVLQDPVNVVGASNHVERAADSAIFQRLVSLRSLMNTRLAWRHLRYGLGPDGAVAVWRRDTVLKIEGFSRTAADPDLDMMFRVEAAHPEQAGRVARSGDVFGKISSQPVPGVIAAARRRQLAAFQVLASTIRRGGRAPDRMTLAHFLESEVLTPAAQAWIVVATVAGAGAGWFPWSTPLLALLLLSFGSAAVTAATLLLRGFAAGGPSQSELGRLLLAGPFEFVLHRPLLAIGRLGAVIAMMGFRTR